LLKRALMYESLEGYSRARIDLDKLLQTHPATVEALLARGRVNDALGRDEASLEDFSRVLEAEPDSVEALTWRGSVLAENGRAKEAEADLEHAAKLEPDNGNVLFWYGYSQAEQEHWAEARESLQRSLRVRPEADWTVHQLARVERNLGDHAVALEHIDSAIALDGEVASYHEERALILEALGREGMALAARRTARELSGASDPDPDPESAPEPGAVLEVLVGAAAIAIPGLLVLSLIALAGRRSTRMALESVGPRSTPLRYDGRGGELFRLYLKNVVLTLLTLGIYRFWARVETRKYRYQHTSFAGGRFDYHATGREKFLGFLKGVLILSPALIGCWWLYRRLAEEREWTGAFLGSAIVFSLVLLVLEPVILVGAQRFNLSRTSFSNLRLRFSGRILELYRIHLLDLLLIPLTLGVFLSWHRVRMRRFRMKHTRIGDEGFDFVGTGEELFGILLLGTLFTYLTLGLHAPWMTARLHRFHVEKTRFRRKHLRSSLTGGMVFTTMVPALLLVVLSLGLALPWAVNRWHRLITDTTSYPEELNLDDLRSAIDRGGSALAEGIGEALGEIGDLLGG